MNAAKVLAAVSLLTLALGCKEKKQTYAEAAQLYDVEMRELTRLEERRDLLKGNNKDGIDLKNVRDSLNSLTGDLGALEGLTKGLVDPAVKEKSDKAAKEYQKTLDEQIEKQSKDAAKLKEAAEEELPGLEEQIAKQKERVEAARKVKEALAP
jgi:hypothetical protein